MRPRILIVVLTTSLAACGGGSKSPPVTAPPPTYSVSGTVSGLTGTLVLRVNATTDVSVTANGAVTLATALANGASYSIAVKTQPVNPTQQCDLANASGTIAAANVSNVAVTCVAVPLRLEASMPANGATGVTRDAPLTLTFSATLDASAATVALANTSGNVSSTARVDGAQLIVTPAAKLARLGAYTLTVSGIKGTGGELLAAPVSLAFTAADGAWSTPVLLETDAGDASQPHVALAPNGDALAVWRQVNGTHVDLLSNHFTAAGWQGVVPVETNDLEDVRDPDVGFDANGNALAVWAQGTGASYKMWTNRFYGTSTWATPYRVEIASGVAEWPVLAIDANGDATVAWNKIVDAGGGMGTQFRPAAAHLDLAIGWTYAPGISNNNYSILTGLCSNGTGRALALWYQAGLGFADIWMNTYVPGTGWLTPAPVEESLTGGADSPRIVCQSDGSALAVWRRFESGVGHLHAARYTGDTWTAPVTLDTSDTPVGAPELASDAQGNAVVVWTQTENGRARLWSRRFVAGQGWAPAAHIDDAVNGDSGWYQLALNARGDGFVIWSAAGAGEPLRTRVARLTGGAFSPAITLDPNSTTNDYYPRVALDPEGNAIAVWQTCTSICDIQASRFE